VSTVFETSLCYRIGVFTHGEGPRGKREPIGSLKISYRKDYKDGSDRHYNWHLAGGAEEKHEDPQVLPVSRSVRDLGNSGIHVSRWS
jgi:hypothetical protein